MSDAPAVLLERLGLRRGGRWILRDVDWVVPAGACAALLGPNGSGKSTLSRIIAAHVWPTAGSCTVLGGRFGQADLTALRRSIRLVQPSQAYDVEPSLAALDVVLTGFFGTLALYDRPSDDM